MRTILIRVTLLKPSVPQLLGLRRTNRTASSSADATIRIWDIATGECVQILRSPRPYEGMNIRGIQGLTAAQQENLTALGATL